jgi:hypothetical protein
MSSYLELGQKHTDYHFSIFRNVYSSFAVFQDERDVEHILYSLTIVIRVDYQFEEVDALASRVHLIQYLAHLWRFSGVLLLLVIARWTDPDDMMSSLIFRSGSLSLRLSLLLDLQGTSDRSHDRSCALRRLHSLFVLNFQWPIPDNVKSHTCLAVIFMHSHEIHTWNPPRQTRSHPTYRLPVSQFANSASIPPSRLSLLLGIVQLILHIIL